MKNKESISKIMTTDVIKLTLNDSLFDAERLFKKHRIRHIPVVKEERIIGMLSLTDLLRVSFVDSYQDNNKVDTAVYKMLTIDQIMANKPKTVSPNSTIKDVAAILASKEFHALPVENEDKLVGIVTTTDLLNYLVKLCDTS